MSCVGQSGHLCQSVITSCVYHVGLYNFEQVSHNLLVVFGRLSPLGVVCVEGQLEAVDILGLDPEAIHCNFSLTVPDNSLEVPD